MFRPIPVVLALGVTVAAVACGSDNSTNETAVQLGTSTSPATCAMANGSSLTIALVDGDCAQFQSPNDENNEAVGITLSAALPPDLDRGVTIFKIADVEAWILAAASPSEAAAPEHIAPADDAGEPHILSVNDTSFTLWTIPPVDGTVQHRVRFDGDDVAINVSETSQSGVAGFEAISDEVTF